MLKLAMDFNPAYIYIYIYTSKYVIYFLQVTINTKTLPELALYEYVANPESELKMVAHEHTEKVLDTQTSSSEGPHIPQDIRGHQTSQLLKQIL
jgi:hypothetical protein